MPNFKNKLAILITSTGWGGLEMNTLKLAKLLSVKGYNVHLFMQEESTIYEKGKEIFSEIHLIKKNRKYFDFKTAKSISKILIKNKISRLLVVDNKDLDLIAWCKKRYFKELKVVYQQHMQIGINKKDWLHSFRFKSIDVWVSPLPFLKREIAVRTHFPLNRVKILPIGVNTKEFESRKYTQDEAKELLNVHSDCPIIGIIGRISAKKGQLFVVQALQQLVQKGIQFNLLIFGSATVNAEDDKAYAEELVQFVQKNNLQDYVYFVEYQPDVAKFYNAIDGFVLASHSETYGMVTIEAMLSGIPVLATDSGGTTEILGDGEFGALYKYNDMADFLPKLELLISRNQDIIDKAEIGRLDAFLRYNVEKEVEGFVEILKGL